jgi:hypothetical protein
MINLLLLQPGDPPPPDGQPVTIVGWLLVVIGALTGAYFLRKIKLKKRP